jgi:hypothetical protein
MNAYIFEFDYTDESGAWTGHCSHAAVLAHSLTEASEDMESRGQPFRLVESFEGDDGIGDLRKLMDPSHEGYSLTSMAIARADELGSC